MDGRVALIIVDMQNKFTAETEGLAESVDSIVGTVNSAIRLFRDAGNPVVYMEFDGRGTCLSEYGHDGDDLVPGLEPPLEGERVLHKTVMNSFNGTGLGDHLREEGCSGVVVCGLVAHYCVLATYFGAFDLGFDARILRGGVAATKKENAEMTQSITLTVAIEDLKGMLPRRPEEGGEHP